MGLGGLPPPHPPTMILDGQKEKPRAYIIYQPSLRSGVYRGRHGALTSAGYSGLLGFIVSSVHGFVGVWCCESFGIKKPSPALVFATSYYKNANVEDWTGRVETWMWTDANE